MESEPICDLLCDLRRQLTSKLLSGHQMIQQKTIVFQVLLYGPETCTVTRESKNSLGVSERKFLRHVNDRGEWRRRYNKEFYSLYAEKNFVWKMRVCCLHWIGRMPDDAIAKIVCPNAPHGARRICRPANQWQDEVENYARILTFRNWRAESRYSDLWRSLISQTVSHQEC